MPHLFQRLGTLAAHGTRQIERVVSLRTDGVDTHQRPAAEILVVLQFGRDQAISATAKTRG